MGMSYAKVSYKKNGQGCIGSFSRTMRKECLGWNRYAARDFAECRRLVEQFLDRLHYHRPHLVLGLRLKGGPTVPLEKGVLPNCRIVTHNFAKG